MKKRAIKVAVFGSVLLVCGLLYGWLCITTGVAIPCVFYQITGFSCPGCGITRMCLNILKGNITEAIKCNPAVFFCMLPFGIVVADSLFRYIKCGEGTMRKWQNVLLYIIIGVLLVYGVLRNIVTY
jgi:hypothetical protein